MEEYISTTSLVQQKFFKLPKLLVYGEKYAKLTQAGIVAYCILYDRMQVSIKNGWIDEQQNTYFVYSNKELSKILKLSIPTVIKIKQQLLSVGLLEEVKTGRANRLYLKYPVPINQAECEYIIMEQNIKDASKRSDEEKRKVSDKLLGNTNAQKTVEVKKLNTNCFLGDNPKNVEVDVVEKQMKLKNLTAEVKNLNTNKNNISKTKTYETYETNESGIDNHFVSDNNKKELNQFEHQTRQRDKLPEDNIFDFTERGIPDFITECIYRFAENQEEFDNVFECIFKAKSNVSKTCGHLILLEDLTQEELVEMKNVIYRSFHKKKTDANLRNFKGYLMASLINYFEKLYPFVSEEKLAGTNLMQDPMDNWTIEAHETQEAEESESIRKLKERIAKLN